MKRDLGHITGKEYDLLIIGGGMYGSTLVWEAVSRGLSVALIEKEDFASATSGNSLKIIHGGLRYLQSLDFKRMLESIRERKILLKIAPHLVHPLPCLMPTFGMTMKSKHVMLAGMIMNDLISFNRNKGSDPQKRIPNGRVISKQECEKQLPVLKENFFTGAALWNDAQAYNTERLVLSFVMSAAQRGADVFNYVEVTDFLKNGSKVTGVKAKDNLTGQEYEIKAKMIVTTAGPWTNKLTTVLSGHSADNKFILSKAINLILKRKIARDYAFGISSPIEFRNGKKYDRQKRRLLFVTPWRDYTVVGTSHLPYDGETNDFKISENDVQDLLMELNEIMPEINLERKDVTFVHGGVLPLSRQPEEGKDVQLLPHYRIVDFHKETGIDGIISVVGVKYTTARDVAEKTMDLVTKRTAADSMAFSTRTEPIYGGAIEDFQSFINGAINNNDTGLPEPVFRQLLYNYGQEYKKIIDLIREKPERAERVAKTTNVIKAEIIHAARNEFAQKLSDVVLRRTELGSGECPGDDGLRSCADILASELDWDEHRIRSEIEEVKAKYRYRPL
ncbi:glycerol-3-phosphate dehydrogenase/oxidase [candidate division KSB1 bacterium]|nr:glycerol-3-phosphate dehydrogenase/oxidase [candidate division KSB1 bacterium]